MEDLSLHILDIAENALNAGASLIEIKVMDHPGENTLQITVRDNGRGMHEDMVKKVWDPFVTTRTTRRVGLGLSLLQQAAQQGGGRFHVTSEPGRGTEVRVEFQRDHLDRKPLGDMGATLVSLISGNPDVDFIFESNYDGQEIELDTREIRLQLDETIPINSPPVLHLIKDLLGKYKG
ncbi:MAG: ATP-binding protein [Pseudomonadota bacterium]